jgi:hypothetical protein
MNQLFEIASALGELAHARYELRNELTAIENAVKARKAAITPPGGWPGKNPDERKAAELAAVSTDETLTLLLSQKDDVEDELALSEADREALIAERDAWQWTIRDREVAAFNPQMMSVFDMMREFEQQRTEEEYNPDLMKQFQDEGNEVEEILKTDPNTPAFTEDAPL